MFQTVVVSFALLAGVVVAGLLLWSVFQSQANLKRRVTAAESGGRPLSLDESVSVRKWGLRQPGEEEIGRSGYRSYRQRNSVRIGHLQIAALFVAYFAIFAAAVSVLGFPIGFITMFLGGQLLAAAYVMWSRRRKRLAEDSESP